MYIEKLLDRISDVDGCVCVCLLVDVFIDCEKSRLVALSHLSTLLTVCSPHLLSSYELHV